jgi:hypothetical protein
VADEPWTLPVVGRRQGGSVWKLVRSDFGIKQGGEVGYVHRTRTGFELFSRPGDRSLGRFSTLEEAAAEAERVYRFEHR